MRSIIFSAFPLLAAALPGAPHGDTAAAALKRRADCDKGRVQCCNSVQDAGSPEVATLVSLLGIALSDTTGQVGITCTPVSVIGAGGASCPAQVLCCQENNFNGLVALGCTPIQQ